MKRTAFRATAAVEHALEQDWVALPGGELEGRRPVVRCPDCREKLVRATRQSGGEVGGSPEPLCFACYRASIARERALKAARERLTASEQQFQSTLPFETIDRARLTRLKIERAGARAAASAGVGRFAERRRRAQIQARHALQQIGDALRAHRPSTFSPAILQPSEPALSAAVHASLPLPSAWLPFAGAR
jgi:hypothetical protein